MEHYYRAFSFVNHFLQLIILNAIEMFSSVPSNISYGKRINHAIFISNMKSTRRVKCSFKYVGPLTIYLLIFYVDACIQVDTPKIAQQNCQIKIQRPIYLFRSVSARNSSSIQPALKFTWEKIIFQVIQFILWEQRSLFPLILTVKHIKINLSLHVMFFIVFAITLFETLPNLKIFCYYIPLPKYRGNFRFL